MAKYYFILLSTLLCAFANPLNEKKTILFYGDSLTAGYGLSKEQAFPALIEEKLNDGSKEYEIINAGLSGETTAGGLNRLDWILKKPVDIFVLELGANDGLRGLPLDQTKKNLQAIIDKVKAKNPDVQLVIAGMMVPPNLGEEYSNEFRSIFPQLAQKNDAILIPFLLDGVAGNEHLNLADGIHPNVDGHKIVAETVLNAIRPIL
ncbi:arylesterase [Fulvivirga lutea]|uniref:Arylesterase n=1 Tax=Fulvivirga lutea TaxID=2810512 RepID=A0A974WEG9_9BACT|nr:arylesterase [Fulvivirga lutea]QSE96124.1 arylesterase [Fulvivirga lutea]